MKYSTTELRAIEADYWDLVSDIDTFEYIQPQNIGDEKKRFLNSLTHKKKYNPQFIYKEISIDLKAIEKAFLYIKSRLNKLNHPLVGQYNQLLKEDMMFLEHIKDRSCASFRHWLSGLYGFPSESEVEAAFEILASIDINQSKKAENTVNPATFKSAILDELQTYQIRDWDIFFEESSAKVSVNPVLKKIKIKRDTLFHQDDIQRLLIHEIGVHVLRSENGSKQNYLLFSKGFPNYLQTEEGIAIWSERKNGLLRDIVIAKYCCRLIAAHYCQYTDFYDIFQKISSYLNDDDCFDVVVRIKRGLDDTSKPGGFTKDQIYLRGLWEIEKLDLETIKKLFVGKIGVQHVKLLEQLDIKLNTNYPEWIDKMQ